MALPLSYNIRNLRQRWKVTLLAIFGIGLVVAVFVTLLSMESGFRLALRDTGSPQNGIVTQRGSMSELTSWMVIGDANTIVVDPRVARDRDGKPMASCEVVVLANRPRRSDNQPANITFDLLPQLDGATRQRLRHDKKARHTEVCRRALDALAEYRSAGPQDAQV